MKKLILILFSLINLNLFSQHITDTLIHPRNVLIETFTGVRCGNSPPAMAKAVTVKKHYPNRVCLLNIHAGFFADTGNTGYYHDLKTPFGTNEDNYFGMSANGTPDGLV